MTGNGDFHNPAIVIHADTAGIGIIHALSLGAVDIITIDRTWKPTLGRFSSIPKLRVTYTPGKSRTLTGILQSLCKRIIGKGVLFVSNDVDLESLITVQSSLPDQLHVPAAPHIGLKIFDKNWQYDLARQVQVPTPDHIRFFAGESPDFHGLRFPLILKPAVRLSDARKKVFRLRLLNNPGEVEQALEEISCNLSGFGFQLAENIPGEPDQLFTVGCYGGRNGKVLRTYTGHKLTQYPYYHGMASIAETIPPPAGLAEMAGALLNHMGFHGISQVEFKLDKRDGLFKLLEINGRPWLWVKLAALSGVNLPLIQYYDVLDDPGLSAALNTPQDDRFFFVHDHHVRINNLPLEKQIIADLQKHKTMVSAIDFRGEWRLAWIDRCISLFKRANQRM
ncbi:MAG: hypothetical protein HY356_07185 [Gammaproteobacteria bacterium]|nr:hypothetical protein [Gammaproteobacteria bacterium]